MLEIKPELLEESIFTIQSEEEFEVVALELFRFQAEHVPVYKNFISALGITPSSIQTLKEIPFFPIRFFKEHIVLAKDKPEEILFLSSGTTDAIPSKHYVHKKSLYQKSFLKGFHLFYGPPSDYCILALLPSYQEREGSSLIYMVNELIKLSNHPKSGYFLSNFTELKETIITVGNSGQKILLIGVTHALLDFAERFSFDMGNTIVMETGGMKGRRKELLREELHTSLCDAFGLTEIHSEYGMTELLSQAYSTGKGLFKCPPWMKVMIREINDPFSIAEQGKTGGINIIDLANIYSCAFITTQDLGCQHTDTSFEVLGRFDYSDVRGCNLLIQ